MRYIVARVIASPRGRAVTARLILDDLPAGIGDEQVLEALEAAGLAAEFSEAGVPFGNHEVKAEARGAWRNVAAIEQAEAHRWAGPPAARPDPAVIAWADLTRTRTRGEGRRVTLRLTDAEHARFTLASQRSGESLQEWMVRAAAALADLEARDARHQAQAIRQADRETAEAAEQATTSTARRRRAKRDQADADAAS